MSAARWQLDLIDPAWLAGLAVIILLGWYARHTLVDASRRQRALSLACRAAVVSLVVFALAGLTARRPSQEVFVVFAVDRSESVGDEASAAADQFIDRALRPGQGRAAFLAFAAEPGTVHEDRQAGTERPKEESARLGTNLAGAIEVAAGAVPPGYVPRVVLLTDGNQTTGDARAAALRAGVPLYTVPLPQRDEPEVQVTEVVVPAQVREGAAVPIEVVIYSNHDDEGVLELFCNSRKIRGVSEKRLAIRKGENRFRFTDQLTHEKLARYRASISGFRDRLLDNNTARGLVSSDGKPRVLIVDTEPRQAEHLTRALEEAGIQVDPPRPPEGLPDSLADLLNYELVVLSNVPAVHPKVTVRQLQLLRIYVQELGGGLLVLGGDQSFGLGGYSRSVLADVLPVSSDFEKDKEKPSLAMVLVIDKSGSMAEAQKMDMAKEAVRGAVELLGPNDRVGVIAFDKDYSWVSELQVCADKAPILARVEGIQAQGGTSILPAMKAAVDELNNLGAAAKYKHMILLTDGIDESSPTDLGEVAARAAENRITVTTVGIGSDADKTTLEMIARRGHGRFHFTDNPAAVPQIFAKETAEASRDAIQEGNFTAIPFRPTAVLANLDWAEAPPLNGYVRTRIKPTAEEVLRTSGRFDPLLAWWRTGLGMCTAFTGDAKTRWSDGWIADWPSGYSKFWAQVVRHTMRSQDARGIEVQLSQKGQRAQIMLDVADADGQYVNQADVDVTVQDPVGRQRMLTLPQTAPGRYAAEFDVAEGDHFLLIRARGDGSSIFHQTRGLSVGYPDELRLRPTDEALLEQLARDTDGQYRPEPEMVFAPDGRTAYRAVPLWPYLLAAAAVLFAMDVGLRRWSLSASGSSGR
jgi:Ca-activated chloride channel homolog